MLSCLVDCTLRMSRACDVHLYSLLLCIHDHTTSGCRLLLLLLLYGKPVSHWVLHSLHGTLLVYSIHRPSRSHGLLLLLQLLQIDPRWHHVHKAAAAADQMLLPSCSSTPP
jgi:hypothetical protein